jgi:hypothetical protein
MKGGVSFRMLLDGKHAHVERFTMAWIDAASFEEKRMRAHTHT